MHEHSITNEIVHQIVHACEDKKILKPKKIIVELGALTTYKKEPLLFYFEKHKKDIKILSKAELEIIEIPGRIMCNECKKESMVEPAPFLLCPKCSSADVKVVAGDKVVIKKIED